MKPSTRFLTSVCSVLILLTKPGFAQTETPPPAAVEAPAAPAETPPSTGSPEPAPAEAPALSETNAASSEAAAPAAEAPAATTEEAAPAAQSTESSEGASPAPEPAREAVAEGAVVDRQIEEGAAVAAGAIGTGMLAVGGLLGLLLIVSFWKIFTKAGRPGWASLIPIYHAYVFCLIAGKPGWWFLLLFIPVVNFVISIILLLALAARFGKSALFGVGLIVLPIIFVPLLAFGDAQYAPDAPPGSVPPEIPPAA